MSHPNVQAFYGDPMAFFEEVHLDNGQRFGDVMTPDQREWLEALTPALSAVANGERSPTVQKFWLEAVKGNAKTTIDALLTLWLLAFNRVGGLLIQVAAADADQAAEVKRAAEDILRANPWLAEVITILTDRIVCQRTESEAEILAADVAGSHGARPDVLILDELVHVQKTEFLENLLDNAAKIPTCLVLATTNPGFTGTWAWKQRELARTSRRWHFQQITMPPPWIDPAEIEEARLRNTPTRFARLWGGVWSSGSGDFLDPCDVAACVTMHGPLLKALPEFVFVGGLDLGIKHDHSALVMLGVHRQNRRRRLAMVKRWAPGSAGKVDLTEVQAGVKAACDLFQPRALNYDPYQAELMAVQLRRQGCRMVEVPFIGANLNEMASEILETFTSRNIDLYNDAGLIRDLGRLTIVEKSYGYKLESVRDSDGHADSAIATALALLAAKHTPAGGAFVAMGVADGQVYTTASDKFPRQTSGWWGSNFLSQHARQEAGTDGIAEPRQGEPIADFIRRAQSSQIVRGGQRPKFVPDNLARHGEE